MIPKLKAWRSPKYLAFVKTLDCANCGLPDHSDPHHIIGVGHHSGMGMKASDELTMPLCRECHTMIHSTPEKWEQQYEWIALTMSKAIRECEMW